MVHLDLLERSKETMRGYQVDLVLFERFLRNRYGEKIELNDISVEDIEDFLKSMKGQGLAPASRNRRLYSLRSFFKFCLRKNLCKVNIASMVEIARLPFKEREYLTEEEVLKVIYEVRSEVIKSVVGLMFYSGLRVSEALSLRVTDVKMAERIIRVRSGKGQKDRSVPICPKLHTLLENYMNNVRVYCNNELFFATKRSGKVSAQYVNYHIHRAIEKLGWNRLVTAHSFRHSFASALINKDVGVFHVQKLLGHADLRVTSRYCHANMTELKNAVDRL